MKAATKFIFLLACGVVALFITLAGWRILNKPLFQPSSRVLVTAAHLPPVKGMVEIYRDEDADVAIFVDEEYQATCPPINGKVTYLNSWGTIKEYRGSECSVVPSRTEVIVPGVSGSPVYYEGVPIGFISGWDGEGRIRVVFL